MIQLVLVHAPVVPDMEALACAARDRRRAACTARWGRVALVDVRGEPLRLMRGRHVVAQARRSPLDAGVPPALDRVGWLLREARAWHALAMHGRRLSLAEVAALEADAEYYYPRRGAQLRLMETA